jgi:hypothetical protein
MTCVYITIDTEYSSGLMTAPCPIDRAENFARSIACITPDGPAGITHKLEVLERHGQKAVFFVDPMAALVWGVAAIEDVVTPILEAGQDVQLHCHTEWLAMAGDTKLVGGRTGHNLADFTFEDQCAILAFARDTLKAAGAPAPVAFRAGNYGADDNTLRALADLGLLYDTSFCPGIADGYCRISLGPEDLVPVRHCGVIEVPVGSIGAIGGGMRHAQITALSLREMTAAVRHARGLGRPEFTFVSHSFELINRRKLSVNRIVRRRFEGLCRELAAMRGVTTANYRDDPPCIAPADLEAEPLPADPLRTGLRVAEQIVSNTLYGAL